VKNGDGSEEGTPRPNFRKKRKERDDEQKKQTHYDTILDPEKREIRT